MEQKVISIVGLAAGRSSVEEIGARLLAQGFDQQQIDSMIGLVLEARKRLADAGKNPRTDRLPR